MSYRFLKKKDYLKQSIECENVMTADFLRLLFSVKRCRTVFFAPLLEKPTEKCYNYKDLSAVIFSLSIGNKRVEP